MTEEHNLRWSDVWLLVSIYFCGLRGHDRLRQAIASADAINHAIINFEELSSALVRLEGHGLIEVRSAPWRVMCTEAGAAIVSPIAAENSLAMSVWREVEKKLGVPPWSPNEPLPHPENNLRYPEFTREEYEKEVTQYLADMHFKGR